MILHDEKNFKKLKQFEANLEALNEHKDLFIRTNG